MYIHIYIYVYIYISIEIDAGLCNISFSMVGVGPLYTAARARECVGPPCAVGRSATDKCSLRTHPRPPTGLRGYSEYSHAVPTVLPGYSEYSHAVPTVLRGYSEYSHAGPYGPTGCSEYSPRPRSRWPSPPAPRASAAAPQGAVRTRRAARSGAPRRVLCGAASVGSACVCVYVCVCVCVFVCVCVS
jgi:hypothetical protein